MMWQLKPTYGRWRRRLVRPSRPLTCWSHWPQGTWWVGKYKKHIVGKYKNLVGKYKNILWAKLSNIKHVVAGVWSGDVANSKIYHVDHVDGFFEKRISSCHREEGNVDCPGDKFHNDKLMREMTKMVLMIVWCISGAGGDMQSSGC